jgi:predicted nucleic acid binding AN1-type Zn finger protein
MDFFLILLVIGIVIVSYFLYEIYQKYLDYQYISTIKKCSFRYCDEEIKDSISCEYCHKQFCKKHQHPYYHNCKEWKESIPDYAPCSFPGCGEIIRRPRRCNYCKQFFCNKHSLPCDHDCVNKDDWINEHHPPGVTIITPDGKIHPLK